MIPVYELARTVATRIASADQEAELTEEVGRITRGEAGSQHLVATEIIVLAALIVQICAVIAELAKLVNTFVERPRHDQLLAVLARLAELSGDEGVKNNERITTVASVALDVLTEKGKGGKS